MNIRLLKYIDAVVGAAAVALLPSAARPSDNGVLTSIIIIRPGGIGDAVLMAPMMRTIKERFPSARITVLAEQRNAGVFTLLPEVSQLYRYDRPAEFLQALAGNYDAVIDTEQWHRLSAAAARLIRARHRIGFDTNERRRMFTAAIPYFQEQYESASFMNLLRPFGIDRHSDAAEAPFLTVPSAAVEKIRRLIEPLDGKPYIVIFPGASIAERTWGTARFRVVAQELDESGFATVVVGSREDRFDGDMIAGMKGLNLAGKTDLAETAAVIERSKLLISGDSGVLHLAVGLDVPTVSLFGAGIEKKWAPQGEKHHVLNHHLPCSPCTSFGTTPACSDGARCMSEITPAEVLAAAARLLN